MSLWSLGDRTNNRFAFSRRHRQLLDCGLKSAERFAPLSNCGQINLRSEHTLVKSLRIARDQFAQFPLRISFRLNVELGRRCVGGNSATPLGQRLISQGMDPCEQPCFEFSHGKNDCEGKGFSRP